MAEFVRCGWHTDGMTWDMYQTLTINERWALHRSIDDLIERTSPDDDSGGGLGDLARPKRWRK